jgi:hypothetical protein
MKKRLTALCLLAVCMCMLSGCALGDLMDKFREIEDNKETETTEIGSRVYMDELKGTLVDFTGNSISLYAQDALYTFDVSNATLECSDGIITGEEICVIYEGQLPDSGTDTSSVEALKVVDDYHNPQEMEEHTVTGQLLQATPNTITISGENGSSNTYVTTGCETYYKNGLKKGATVYLHYYGESDFLSEDASVTPNTGYMKVVSMSDTDPLNVVTPTAAGKTSTEGTQKMRATIVSLEDNSLTLLLSGNVTLSLDLSGIPCYFKGGITPGSRVTILYTGEFDGSTTNGIVITYISGDDPSKLKDQNITFHITGTIIASTANTVTLRTEDGAIITCNTENASNTSTGGMEIGDGIQITFNPNNNRNSTIFTCIKIEDA